MSAGTGYSLTMANQSTQSWTFYVYQQPPPQATNVFALAWLASPFLIVPGNQIEFLWDLTYNFVWSDTGQLAPGVIFNANGSIAADPAGANTTTFSTIPGPNLSAATEAPPAGSLVINDASSVPNNTFSVGVGMSGFGTFAVQAGPNLQHVFTPTPSYFIAAGQNVQVGTILDIQTIAQTTGVVFPANQFNATAILGQNNLWSISYS